MRGIIIIVSLLAGAFIAYLIFWRFYFLREPARSIPDGPSLVSPASGKVIKVMEFGRERLDVPKGLMGQVIDAASGISEEGKMIVIFMSPFDVHVQRAPLDGKITLVKHSKGKFNSATSIALENEKNEMMIEKGPNKIKVIQVAGFLARRIECFVAPGQEVKKGDRIGRINLGSQVIVILPKSMEIKVKEGERVTEGETVIAEP